MGRASQPLGGTSCVARHREWIRFYLPAQWTTMSLPVHLTMRQHTHTYREWCQTGSMHCHSLTMEVKIWNSGFGYTRDLTDKHTVCLFNHVNHSLGRRATILIGNKINKLKINSWRIIKNLHYLGIMIKDIDCARLYKAVFNQNEKYNSKRNPSILTSLLFNILQFCILSVVYS